MYIGDYFINVELILKAVTEGLTLVIMLFGLLISPILPGLTVIWIAALVYGLVIHFSTLGWVMFGIITVLMIGGSLIDNILMGTRAHKEGAPWWVLVIALLVGIVGALLIPIPIIGGVLAALVTLFGIEWLRRKDWRKALAAIKGMLIGWGWAFLFRFIIALVMIGLWMVWAWA